MKYVLIDAGPRPKTYQKISEDSENKINASFEIFMPSENKQEERTPKERKK
jgi:hypothetical protein